MTKEYLENRTWWDEVTPVHVKAPSYGVEEFLAGATSLRPIELQALPDVRGKSLLHLQCHFGQDTLSWARRGAKVTGVDFSPQAIKVAQDLATKINQPEARFLCADIMHLDQHLHERFDIVFTSYGVLNWLPDIKRWGQMVARYLKPGGTFFMAEVHPFSMMFDNDQKELRLTYEYFFAGKPIVDAGSGNDYADPSYKTRSKTYEWPWTLTEIYHALQDAGLKIEEMREYPVSCYQAFPALIPLPDRMWGWPDGSVRLPLLFSIKAKA